MVVIVHEELSSKAVELKVATLHEWKCLFKKNSRCKYSEV